MFPVSSSIGTIKAVLFTLSIVASRYKNFDVSINGFGRYCSTFSRCFFALPLISGFNLLQKVANEWIAARVSSISYTLSGALVKTGIYPFNISKYPSGTNSDCVPCSFVFGRLNIVSKIPTLSPRVL